MTSSQDRSHPRSSPIADPDTSKWRAANMRALADGRFDAQRDDLHRDLVRKLGTIDQDYINRGLYRSSAHLCVRLDAWRSYLRSVLACKIKTAVDAHEVAGVHVDAGGSQALQSDLRRIHKHELEAALDDGRKQCENSGGDPRIADQFLNAVRRDCSRELERAVKDASAEIARLELMRMRQVQTPGDVASPHPLKLRSPGSLAGDPTPSEATPSANAGSGPHLQDADNSSPSPSNSGTIDASVPSTLSDDEVEAAVDRLSEVGSAEARRETRERQTAESTQSDVAPAKSLDNAFVRDGLTWRVTFQGTSAPVLETVGMAMIAKLLRSPGVPVRAEILMPPAVTGDSGGPVMDSTTTQQCRERLRLLSEQLEDAEEREDAATAAELEVERDELIEYVKRAQGISGRPRRLGDEDRKLRTRVRKNLETAIARIRSVHPLAAAHFEASIRGPGGAAPVYEPEHTCGWVLSG